MQEWASPGEVYVWETLPQTPMRKDTYVMEEGFFFFFFTV